MTRIDANPGLYFEWLHNIRFRRASWRVAVVADLNRLEHDFPEEYINLKDIYNRCLRLPVKLECSSILRTHYLSERIKEAMENHAEIKTIVHQLNTDQTEPDDSPKTIVRRNVPFGFIGTVSRTLFGTLDMDDAQHFDSQIDKLYTTEKKLIQLTKNQTHIVMSDLHNVHKLISELIANIKDNRAKVNELVSVLNEETLLNYTIVLSQYASSIENSLNHYISASQNFMAIILSAQQGKLHPSLLSNCKLRAIVNEIHDSASQYEVPMPQDYLRIEEIVKIAPVTWKHRAGKLIFTVHIPLVNRVEYHLYQLHSLPILQNISDHTNVWAYIHPQYPYLGLSNDHSTYFGATETFLHTCTEIWNTHLCGLDIPLYEASISESCEISLLLRPKKETLQNCNIHIAPIHGTYWSRLVRTRGWLYSIKESETLQILCENQGNTLISIQGTGIIELNPDCIAKTRTTILIGIRTFTSTEQFYYNPNLLLNISEISPKIGQYHSIKPINDYTPVSVALDSKNIESLQEIENKMGALEIHNRQTRFHFGLTYGTVMTQAIILIGVIIYYSWNPIRTIPWTKLLCRSKNQSTQASNEVTESAHEEIPTTTIQIPAQRIIVN
ncbi:hypothetical protein ANTRET_LOCUS11142 [Anthophora retusa]